LDVLQSIKGKSEHFWVVRGKWGQETKAKSQNENISERGRTVNDWSGGNSSAVWESVGS